MSDVNLQGSFGQDGAPIIESGSNANGEYIKYADGTMICTRTDTVNRATDTASGGIYRSDAITGVAMPQTFTSLYYTSASIVSAGSNLTWLAAYVNDNPTNSQFGGYYVLDTNSDNNNATYEIGYIAVGRWK